MPYPDDFNAAASGFYPTRAQIAREERAEQLELAHDRAVAAIRSALLAAHAACVRHGSDVIIWPAHGYDVDDVRGLLSDVLGEAGARYRDDVVTLAFEKADEEGV